MTLNSDWPAQAKLWLVLDRHAAEPRSLEEVTELCIASGVEAVLCRIKDLPQTEVRKLAIPVREVCARLASPFIMSHDVELACELSADGIQLGLGDPPLEEVRGQLPPGTKVGYSTHSVDEALDRRGEGADYVFLGPIFPTPAKLKYGAPLGLDVVCDASARLTGFPVVFIGGIKISNISDVVQAGGSRVAAIAALQAVDEPSAAAAAFKRQLASQ